MQALQNNYRELVQRIDDYCAGLIKSGCELKNIYLGESEYKLLHLQLSPRHRFSVVFQQYPQLPYEIYNGMRIYHVYQTSHLEITWHSPFQHKFE